MNAIRRSFPAFTYGSLETNILVSQARDLSILLVATLLYKRIRLDLMNAAHHLLIFRLFIFRPLFMQDRCCPQRDGSDAVMPWRRDQINILVSGPPTMFITSLSLAVDGVQSS